MVVLDDGVLWRRGRTWDDDGDDEGNDDDDGQLLSVSMPPLPLAQASKMVLAADSLCYAGQFAETHPALFSVRTEVNFAFFSGSEWQMRPPTEYSRFSAG